MSLDDKKKNKNKTVLVQSGTKTKQDYLSDDDIPPKMKPK